MKQAQIRIQREAELHVEEATIMFEMGALLQVCNIELQAKH